MMELRNVIKIYQNNKKHSVIALNKVSFCLPNKGMIFLQGKSGSGKTTLLNLIGGLDNPDNGDIVVDGTSISDMTQSELDSYRNSYVGFIFQDYNLLSDFTIKENIALANELQGQKVSDEKIQTLLRLVDMSGYENRMPSELSGGQIQRIAIARALAKGPQILLADEPTGALDSETAKVMFQTLKEISKERLVLVVSHDRDFANQYADRIIELSDGNVIGDSDKMTGVDRQISSLNLGKVRLPKKSAYKIAVNSIRHKKFRLSVVLLLSIFAIMMVGLSDVFSAYDKATTLRNSVFENENHYVGLKKEKELTYGGKTSYYDGFHFSDEEVENLKERFGQDVLGVYIPAFANLSIENNYGYADRIKNTQYGSCVEKISGFAEVTDDTLASFQFQLLAGTLPDGNKNEIAVSKYVYECFRLCSYRNYSGPAFQIENLQNGEMEEVLDWNTVYANPNLLSMKSYNQLMDYPADITEIQSYEDLIGKTIFCGRGNYTITGIIDTQMDMTRYATLTIHDMSANVEKTDVTASILSNELKMEQSYGASCIAYVGKGKLEQLAEDYPSVVTVPDMNLTFKNQYVSFGSSTVARLSELDLSKISFGESDDLDFERAGCISNGDSSALQENELIVSGDEVYAAGAFIIDGKTYMEEHSDVSLEKKRTQLEYVLTYSDYRTGMQGSGYKIVDQFYNEVYQKYDLGDTLIVSDELFEKITEGREGLYEFAFVSLPKSRGEMKNLVKKCEDTDMGIRYSMINSVIYELNSLDDMITSMTKLFRYISLLLILFVILLMSNFISVGIRDKAKEIGILRSMGAGRRDIYRIFLIEGVLIAGISAVLGAILTIIATEVANQMIRHEFLTRIVVADFTIRQILLIFGISICVSLLSSLVPIKQMADKKPIDIIKQ